MAAISKGYQPSSIQIEWILGLVKEISECNRVDSPGEWQIESDLSTIGEKGT